MGNKKNPSNSIHLIPPLLPILQYNIVVIYYFPLHSPNRHKPSKSLFVLFTCICKLKAFSDMASWISRGRKYIMIWLFVHFAYRHCNFQFKLHRKIKLNLYTLYFKSFMLYLSVHVLFIFSCVYIFTCRLWPPPSRLFQMLYFLMLDFGICNL